MNTTYSVLVILIGLVLRLALPVAITILAVLFLRKLDNRWQAEAEDEEPKPDPEQSWDIQDCPIEQGKVTPARFSVFPCWQMNRLSNGYLNEQCLTCKVFHNAPVPVHIHA
jgi:hypothetical protein